MLRPVHDVENVLGDAGFWNALVVAGAGVAVVWFRVRQHRFEPGVALVVVVAALVGLREGRLLAEAFAVALGLVVVAELVFRQRALVPRVLVYAMAGATVVATLPVDWTVWCRLALIPVVVVG